MLGKQQRKRIRDAVRKTSAKSFHGLSLGRSVGCSRGAYTPVSGKDLDKEGDEMACSPLLHDNGSTPLEVEPQYELDQAAAGIIGCREVLIGSCVSSESFVAFKPS